MEFTRLDLRQLPGRERNLSWKVNQEMLAMVVGREKDGSSLLRINGQLYHASSRTPLDQGSSMIVRVASLSPQLELDVVENLRAPNISNQPATVVSGNLMEQARRLRQNTFTQLAQIPYQKPQSELQSLPGDSMILLHKLKRSMLKPGQLGRLEHLRAALDNSGLFLESKLAAASQGLLEGENPFEGDLKALLLRLVNSLGGGGGLRYNHPGQALEPYGLSLYRELYHQPIGLKRQVIDQAEEVLKKIVDTQYRAVDETDESWHRWVFDLPLYNPDQPESVPLIIHGEKEDILEDDEDRRWAAEFSLTLKNHGRVKARMNLMAQCLRIEFLCEDELLADRLHQNQDRLRHKLGDGGLELHNFKSFAH